MALRWVTKDEGTAAQRRVYFHLVDATDGLTAETGEAGGAPEISTNGGGWTTTGIGTLTHIGNGRYYADLTAGAVATAGDWIETRYKSANTAESPGDSVLVVNLDLTDAVRLGITALPNANAGASGGLAVLTSNLAAPADLKRILDTAVTEGNSGDLANNVTQFFDVNPTSSQTIDDVGGGGATGWTSTEKEYIRHRLGIEGTATAPPTATPSLALEASVTTVQNRLGAWTGTGDNTVLGAFKLVCRSDASAVSDIGGTYDDATDSLQAIRDRGDSAWITATNVTVTAFSAAGLADMFDTDSGTTYGAAVAGSVVKEIVDNSGGASAASIADAVWDEARSGHVAAGSAGEALEDGYNIGFHGTVSDAGPTATDFDGDAGLSASDDEYNGHMLFFKDGPNQGLARKIQDYTGATKNLLFTGEPFPNAPANGNAFVILGFVPA